MTHGRPEPLPLGMSILDRAIAGLWDLDLMVRRQGGEHWWTGRVDNTGVLDPPRTVAPCRRAATHG